jgi:hypothetical protein
MRLAPRARPEQAVVEPWFVMTTLAHVSIAALALAACSPASAPIRGGLAMDGLLEVKNITVSIRRPPREVYAFVVNGENIPRWASGLGNAIQRTGDTWVAEGPIGKVKVRFVAPNELGVADHDVMLESGEVVRNPIRILANADGSTVIFTLMRRPGVSEQDFKRDAKAVENDLAKLKTVLESNDRVAEPS